MGDRGNIVILDRQNPPVALYTHWGGYALKEAAAAGLRRAEDRWTDPAYLARSIFCEMGAASDGTTGFGIASALCDNEYPLLVLDWEDFGTAAKAYTVAPPETFTTDAIRTAPRLEEWTLEDLAAQVVA
jgi:hypothetical protein